MSEQLSELVGFLLSDGSVYYDKSKRTYCIQFTNKVNDLRGRFVITFAKCFGKRKFHQNKCKNAISIRTFSSKIAKELFLLSPSYRTKQYDDGSYPNCKIPNFILSERRFIVAFLRAYCSSDGCIYANSSHPNGVVEISCYHPILKTQISECLDILGIQNRINKKGIRIYRKNPVAEFFKIVGFLEESVICSTNSKNYGIGKNEMFRRSFFAQT